MKSARLFPMWQADASGSVAIAFGLAPALQAWMLGYVGVVSHPYFAVTGYDGAFHLANIPPGHYTLEAWHERFGTVTEAVDVTASGSVKADFSYTGTKMAPPPPGN